MGLFRDNETNNLNGMFIQGLKSQLAGGKPVGYITSEADDLNTGLKWINPASGQGRTWTPGLRITGPSL